MQIKTYRAKSVQAALALVRADLGPDAAVLHTREVSPGALGWLGGARQIEVIATPEAERVPSRLPMPETSHENEHRFRDRLAATASEGFDLSQAHVDELAAEGLDASAWPQEVASRFIAMLRALPPQDRQKLIGAIAECARG